MLYAPLWLQAFYFCSGTILSSSGLTIADDGYVYYERVAYRVYKDKWRTYCTKL